MSMRHFALLLGLTTAGTATLLAPLPTRAASCETGDLFDFSSIQFIATRPIASNNCLRLFGKRTDPTPQGFVGYGAGHTETALNSPGNPAPYYAAGIDFSPENVPGATRAATLLNNITGFSNFATFLTNNSINVDRIGFSFGPKNGDFTKSWNLGDDINGQNYFSSPTSSLEERIYAANHKEVESFLLLDNTKILSFGYSDIYSFLEYGATTAPDDDSEAIISDPFSVSKVAGLLGEFDGLANAFLVDVGSNKVQLVSEDAAVVPDDVFIDPSIGPLNPVVSIQFPLQLRIVSTPEPSVTLGLMSLGIIAVGCRLKNKIRKE
ncbi:MAG: PEP-CTERM sorting domain-containing protein [Microcystis aeruginosa Ma_SC_T_19800800_S464]|uniref:PEP-CTERM sorting domain-containing protein n=1 Tax=Microcystis aeruginosa Ma_SC_T_19800800_S464 TaxID=2486257 RepID=A0A552DRT8_MICAE|nr:MAG: PEP-CTERM sorting domain-containing protein [Microcystis aeruginosa Ma_SC_T_19800800_S464]